EHSSTACPSCSSIERRMRVNARSSSTTRMRVVPRSSPQGAGARADDRGGGLKPVSRASDPGERLLREQVIEPEVRHLLQHRIGLEAVVEVLEVDLVEYLVLVEAGEHEALATGRRVHMALEALAAHF